MNRRSSDGGRANFNRRLSASLKKMRDGSAKGLRLGAILISQRSKELTPADEGKLRASHGTDFEKGRLKAYASIFLTAEYAVWVHENLEMKLRGQKRKGSKGRYWDPNGARSKFLETAKNEKKGEVLQLIRKFAKV